MSFLSHLAALRQSRERKTEAPPRSRALFAYATRGSCVAPARLPKWGLPKRGEVDKKTWHDPCPRRQPGNAPKTSEASPNKKQSCGHAARVSSVAGGAVA